MPKDDKSEIIVLRGDKKDVDGGEKHVKAMVKQFIEDGFQLEVIWWCIFVGILFNWMFILFC